MKDLEPLDNEGEKTDPKAKYHLTKDNKPLIGILWLIYGYENKLSHEDFLDKVATPECNWILDPAKIR